MRNGTSKSPLRTRFEPAHFFVPSPCGYGTAAAALRSSGARFRRAPNARPGNGWTAFRVSLQVAFGHPPGPYAYRGLRARTSLSLARSGRSLRIFCRRSRIMQKSPTRIRVEPNFEATSRFFEKGLNQILAAAMTWHKTLQMLKRGAHLRAKDLAKRVG